MRDRPHWSYSALSDYLRCPLRFYFRRVLRLPAPNVPAALVLGSAVHAALAEYHRGLREQEWRSAEAIAREFLSEWKRREAHEDIAYRDGETRDATIEVGLHLVAAYLKEPPPEGIVAVESEFLVPLRNSAGEYLETPLIAVADLITESAGELKVTEFKTSGRAYAESEANLSLQPTCYAHAVRETFGRDPVVEYTVLVKTKTPKVQRLTTARYDADFGRLGDLVDRVEQAVRHEVFYPVENPLNCSGCPYREPCRDWRGTATPDAELVSLNVREPAAAC